VAVIILPHAFESYKDIATQILQPFHVETYFYNDAAPFIESLFIRGIPTAVIVMTDIMAGSRLQLDTYREDLHNIPVAIKNYETELFVVISVRRRGADKGPVSHIDGKSNINPVYGYNPLQITLEVNGTGVIRDLHYQESINLISQLTHLPVVLSAAATPYVAVIILPNEFEPNKDIAMQILQPFHVETYFYGDKTKFIESLILRGIPTAVIVMTGIMTTSRLNLSTYTSDLSDIKTAVDDYGTPLFVALLSRRSRADTGPVPYIGGKTEIRNNYGYEPLQFTLDETRVIRDLHYDQSIKLISQLAHLPVVVSAWAAAVVILMLL